jgi:putative (di)nucleoside polyphosphate hydrolase
VPKEYRLGVVGVFVAPDGKILVCERADRLSAWQFPQGGIDDGEDPTQAIKREIMEELGCGSFEILSTSTAWTKYDFPEEFETKITKVYCGQKHLWFHLRFEDGKGPDLSLSDGEFRAFKWVDPKDVLGGVALWKRTAYEEGLKLLKLL